MLTFKQHTIPSELEDIRPVSNNAAPTQKITIEQSAKREIDHHINDRSEVTQTVQASGSQTITRKKGLRSRVNKLRI